MTLAPAPRSARMLFAKLAWPALGGGERERRARRDVVDDLQHGPALVGTGGARGTRQSCNDRHRRRQIAAGRAVGDAARDASEAVGEHADRHAAAVQAEPVAGDVRSQGDVALAGDRAGVRLRVRRPDEPQRGECLQRGKCCDGKACRDTPAGHRDIEGPQRAQIRRQHARIVGGGRVERDEVRSHGQDRIRQVERRAGRARRHVLIVQRGEVLGHLGRGLQAIGRRDVSEGEHPKGDGQEFECPDLQAAPPDDIEVTVSDRYSLLTGMVGPLQSLRRNDACSQRKRYVL